MKNWFASAWFLEGKHPERLDKRKDPPADDRERDLTTGLLCCVIINRTINTLHKRE